MLLNWAHSIYIHNFVISALNMPFQLAFTMQLEELRNILFQTFTSYAYSSFSECLRSIILLKIMILLPKQHDDHIQDHHQFPHSIHILSKCEFNSTICCKRGKNWIFIQFKFHLCPRGDFYLRIPRRELLKSCECSGYLIFKCKFCELLPKHLLRYQAISSSGVPLVEELLFLLFILRKTTHIILKTRTFVHYKNKTFCDKKKKSANLRQFLCVGQIIHGDGQEDVQQCVCGGGS